ncbi:MAG: Tol-Pal system protein TolB [Chlamydiia bacterium]|nr:Tol-Pal system protein TolB [Chlamydiia bacterium]
MKFLCALFLLSFSLFADVPETLEVRLAVEEQLIPIYLTGAEKHPLFKVFAFDLKNNGTTTLAPKNAEREELAAKKLTKAWNRQGVYYVVHFETEGDLVQARLWDVEGRNEVRFGPVAADRAHVHELADAIHLKIAGAPGIASTRILYTDKAGEGGDVWIVDYDGANARRLTNQNALCVTPHFIAPENGKISSSYFYVCYKSGQPKVFLSTLNGGNGDRVLALRGNQLMPALDRARRHLALISDASGNPDVFLVDFDAREGVVGKPRQVYAVPYATQATPTFSPDGKQLAFVSNKDGAPKIYVMDVPPEGLSAKEIKPRLLVKRSSASSAPCWSPDGTKIAYTSKVDGARQIFVFNLQNGENEQITAGPGDKENPTWAPNSLHLCYNQSSNKECNLFIINTRQKKPLQITFGSSEKKFPSWEAK